MISGLELDEEYSNKVLGIITMLKIYGWKVESVEENNIYVLIQNSDRSECIDIVINNEHSRIQLTHAIRNDYPKFKHYKMCKESINIIIEYLLNVLERGTIR